MRKQTQATDRKCPWYVDGYIASGDPFNPNTDSGRFSAMVTA